MRDNGSDLVVLLEYGCDGRLDIAVGVDKLDFFFENAGSEITNILNFFLEIHQLKGSGIL